MDIDLIGSLFTASNNSSSGILSNKPTIPRGLSPDDATSVLMQSFNEADSQPSDDISWDDLDSVSEDTSEETEEPEVEEDTSEETEETEDNSEETETDVEEDEEEESDDDNESSDGGEILGSYESIKDEIEEERKVLSDVYERFFTEIIEPLFRKIEDSNINVAFDTMELKTNGIIRIELSHRNSDSTADMEINIFANTVNGEFLGMENSDGEAVTTSLEDVSLDDLLNILIKVLG